MKHAVHYTIEVMRAQDVEPATRMRYTSWVDAYVNEELGVTKEWIEARGRARLNPEVIQAAIKSLAEPTRAAWVAKDERGEVIGAAIAIREADGTQEIGSLYINKQYYGVGLGRALMQKLMEWLDTEKPIQLDVVAYNERAKAFYRKWGFVKVPGNERLYANKIPQITMIRKGLRNEA